VENQATVKFTKIAYSEKSYVYNFAYTEEIILLPYTPVERRIMKILRNDKILWFVMCEQSQKYKIVTINFTIVTLATAILVNGLL